MKNSLIAAVLLFSTAMLLNFNKISFNSQSSSSEDEKFSMPADVKQIVDNSCAGCHSSDSKNEKAKLKLKFDELGDLKTARLAGKLSKIAEVLEKDKMPPKKFREHYPDKVPTAEQHATLKNWAESTAKSLAGE